MIGDPDGDPMDSLVALHNDQSDAKKSFTHVRVQHNFRGSNNDELCMKKDDIITLTQTPSGGWWEGTLDAITGWFPANYVTPIQPNDPIYQQLLMQTIPNDMAEIYGRFQESGFGNGMSNVDLVNTDNLTEYRAIVIKDIEDSEYVFIQSLQDAINHYLMPLYQFKIFPTDTEINTVLRSITEICSVHRRFLTSIDKLKNVSPKESRIGGLFLQFAPQFKHAHFEYCSNHARFVHLIEKYKKEICASFASHPVSNSSAVHLVSSPSHHVTTNTTASQQQQPQPNSAIISMPNVIITSSLSVSFRRLDKYPALLQELQRYTEENHVDRGDTQRAGFLYREIAMSCLELRRRKEMELEVMLGNIRNFNNLKIESYGNIIQMEPVSILILPHWTESKKDCYLVLFSKVLMILSVGNEMTSFTYESMMKLETARLQIPPNTATTTPEVLTYQLEITGHSAHPLSDSDVSLVYVVQFVSQDIWKDWYQLLQKHIRHLTASVSISSSGASVLPTDNNTPLSFTASMSSSTSVTSPQSGCSGTSFSPTTTNTTTSSDQPVPMIPSGKPPVSRIPSRPPPPVEASPSSFPPTPHHRSKPITLTSTCLSLPKRTSYWSDQILAPHTPYRPYEHTNQTKSDGGGSAEPNDDMQLLNLIDAYHRKFPHKDGHANLTKKLSNPNIMSMEMDSESEPSLLVEIVPTTNPPSSTVHRSHSGRNTRKNSLTSLAAKINKLSISSMDRDVLYEIYDQLRLMRNELSHVDEKVRDERRQRKRLHNMVNRLQQYNSNSQAD